MKEETDYLTIAVDGYSSCGKSTFARMIARELDYLYIDSGAMYRAVTLLALENHAIEDDRVNEKILHDILEGIDIGFKEINDSEYHIYLNGRDVENDIRGSEVSSNVSLVSKIGIVRDKMVALQRKLSNGRGVVMDGRDIGTVVFPDADIKIFMTADPYVRAERRYKELLEKGYSADFKDVQMNIAERDRIDTSRAISPLQKAEDARVLDNTGITVDEQMKWFNKILEEKLK